MMREVVFSIPRDISFLVYGFGSFFRSHICNDVDLLFIFEDEISPLVAFDAAERFSKRVAAIIAMPVDFLALSCSEFSSQTLLEHDNLIALDHLP